MRIEPMSVPDAFVITPRVFGDDRGMFLETFRGDLLAQAMGRRVDVVQANHSQSRRGSVRGIHIADVPPGQAKVVYCVRGAILDVVVDLRVGSPTFGQSASERLDDTDRRSMFVPEGFGHGFAALSDRADVVYLVSSAYDPATEHEVNPLDPALGLSWGLDIEPVLSPKDAAAPTLAEALAAGVLPTYEACQARYAEQAVRPA